MLGIDPARRLFGYGGHLIARTSFTELTRDNVSAVWKLSNSGPNAVMKHSSTGKESAPGRPVVFRRLVDQPHDADAALEGLAKWQPIPLAGALQAFVNGRVAVTAQHRQQHIFGHAGGERGVDHAPDRHLRRQAGIVEQMVDARAQREYRAQVGIARRCHA